MPLMLLGLVTKSWNSFHSPWPAVAPKDAGCRSDMSNTAAFTRPAADLRCSGSLYADGGTSLFGDEKPPRFAQMIAAAGVARELISALPAGVSFSIVTMSPPPTDVGLEPLIDGKSNTL